MKSVPLALLWQIYYDRETYPDYTLRFWNCGTEITREEIKSALDTQNFNLRETCGSHRQGNREWHIRQIAGMVDALKKGEKLEPVRVDANWNLLDGCHRLYAHRYLNCSMIEVSSDLL